jgi:ABC-type branched-subunit amino acid transport system ATPase component
MSQRPTVRAGGLVLTAVQFVIIGLAIVVMAAVHGLLRYTKLGKAMRATSANRSLARNCGIRTDGIVTVTRAIGGERKMLAMGRVLMLEPAVFLLDEPTANLATELITGHVRALAEAGAAVLIVEQRARAVLAISDYTYVLGGGQVLMADTPARLNASQEFTESFFGVGPKVPDVPHIPESP